MHIVVELGKSLAPCGEYAEYFLHWDRRVVVNYEYGVVCEE
jgi:hypothetical protein